MEQNTKNWLAWRQKGIGASDLPIIMGVSPYKTALELWREKTQEEPTYEPPNFIQRKGHEMEIKARSLYELMYDIEMPPRLAEHKDYPHFRASLDGYNEGLNRICEIKYVGKKLSTEVPEKYWPQVQWQLFVSGAQSCDFYQFDGEHAKNINVLPDLEYIEKLVKAASDFWQAVVEKKEPGKAKKDAEEITDSALKKLVELYMVEKEKLDAMSLELDAIKRQIFKQTAAKGDHIRTYNGAKIQLVERKGAVDYSQIPELTSVNLDNYRKNSTTYWDIKLPRKKANT